MAFAEKQDILAVIGFLRPDYTESDISDAFIDMAASRIKSELAGAKISNPVDINDSLKCAEICFYVEYSGMVREVENAIGVVSEETVGGYRKRYESGMPLFFFSQGAAKPFLELLQHETWRMMAFSFMRQYVQQYFVQTRGTIRAAPVIRDYEFERGC